MSSFTRDELIELVRKISECDGTEDEINSWILLLEESVPHPSVSDLIFYPDKPLTPAEIVDEALAYNPLFLTDGSNPSSNA